MRLAAKTLEVTAMLPDARPVTREGPIALHLSAHLQVHLLTKTKIGIHSIIYEEGST